MPVTTALSELRIHKMKFSEIQAALASGLVQATDFITPTFEDPLPEVYGGTGSRSVAEFQSKVGVGGTQIPNGFSIDTFFEAGLYYGNTTNGSMGTGFPVTGDFSIQVLQLTANSYMQVVRGGSPNDYEFTRTVYKNATPPTPWVRYSNAVRLEIPGNAAQINGVLPVLNGGTGADTAEGARTALNAAAANHTHDSITSHSHDYLPANTTSVNPTGTQRYNVEGYVYATRLYGAVFQDYAELRAGANAMAMIPGTVVSETVCDRVEVCRKDRSTLAHVVSDTYGSCIGCDDVEYPVPVALAGRVLALYSGPIGQYRQGDVVCASRMGTIRRMKRWEQMLYPASMMGVVAGEPVSDTWNGICTQGRIWISVK